MNPVLFRLMVIACAAFGVAGCTSASYLAGAVNGHIKIMAARKDVAEVIADPAAPRALRTRLETAVELRKFATDRLALPQNDSYRKYVDLGRNYVTLAIYAAPEFSLAPKVWCFAVFGCVPYRGYFSETAARREAAALGRRGFDVHATGVIAYSTLGWMSDPLLNTMLGQDDAYLAGMIFHELAHQRVYVKGDSGFNEAFAVAVETTGVEAWLGARGDAAGLAAYREARKRHADFLTLLLPARDELNRIYRSAAPPERMRAQKAAAIERLRARYRQMRDRRWNGDRRYDAWFDQPINNAKLAAASVYDDRVPAFLRLFDLCERDYPRFYEAVKRIGALNIADRSKALENTKTCG